MTLEERIKWAKENHYSYEQFDTSDDLICVSVWPEKGAYDYIDFIFQQDGTAVEATGYTLLYFSKIDIEDVSVDYS